MKWRRAERAALGSQTVGRRHSEMAEGKEMSRTAKKEPWLISQITRVVTASPLLACLPSRLAGHRRESNSKPASNQRTKKRHNYNFISTSRPIKLIFFPSIRESESSLRCWRAELTFLPRERRQEGTAWPFLLAASSRQRIRLPGISHFTELSRPVRQSASIREK